MAAKKKGAAKKGASKKSSSQLKADFTGVEVGGSRVPEGQYLARPIEAAIEEGNAGNYVAWVYQVTEGKQKGKKLYDNNSLSQQSLWRLRLTLEAMGQEVPDGPMDIDLEALCEDEDNVVCIDVTDDTYQGKKKSKIIGVYPKDDFDGGEGEEEEEEAPDFAEMDDDDLKSFAKEHDLEIDGLKKLSGKKLRKAVEEAYSAGNEPEGEEEEDEDDDDKSSKKSSKKGKDEDDRPSEDDINEMDADELANVIDEHDLEVDLDDHKTLKKKRAAVVEALAGGDEDGDGEKVTADEINEMGGDELEAFVEKHELDIELKGSTKKKRRQVLKAAKEAELLADEEEEEEEEE